MEDRGEEDYYNEARRGRSDMDRPGWHAVCKLLDAAASDPYARVAPQALAAAARMDDVLTFPETIAECKSISDVLIRKNAAAVVADVLLPFVLNQLAHPYDKVRVEAVLTASYIAHARPAGCLPVVLSHFALVRPDGNTDQLVSTLDLLSRTVDICSAAECHTPCMLLSESLARHLDVRVRCAAAQTLFSLAKRFSTVDSPAITTTIIPLFKALCRDDSAFVRASCAAVLASLGPLLDRTATTELLPLYLSWTIDAHRAVRMAAVRALGSVLAALTSPPTEPALLARYWPKSGSPVPARTSSHSSPSLRSSSPLSRIAALRHLSSSPPQLAAPLPARPAAPSALSSSSKLQSAVGAFSHVAPTNSEPNDDPPACDTSPSPSPATVVAINDRASPSLPPAAPALAHPALHALSDPLRTGSPGRAGALARRQRVGPGSGESDTLSTLRPRAASSNSVLTVTVSPASNSGETAQAASSPLVPVPFPTSPLPITAASPTNTTATAPATAIPLPIPHAPALLLGPRLAVAGSPASRGSPVLFGSPDSGFSHTAAHSAPSSPGGLRRHTSLRDRNCNSRASSPGAADLAASVGELRVGSSRRVVRSRSFGGVRTGAQSLEVKQLLKLYADVLDPRGLFQPDMDATVVAASLLPVATWASGGDWAVVRAVLKQLALSDDTSVRATVAKGLHVVALIVGPQNTEEHLLPHFVTFLSDWDEVFFAAIWRLPSLLAVVFPEARLELVTAFLHSRVRSWRQVLLVAHHATSFCELCGTEWALAVLWPALLAHAAHPAARARRAVHKALGDLVTQFTHQSTVSLWLECLPGQLQVIAAMATHKLSLHRKSFVELTHVLHASLPPAMVTEALLPPLLVLVRDPVSTVRVGLARLLLSLAEMPQLDCAALREGIASLKTDSDTDVRHLACGGRVPGLADAVVSLVDDEEAFFF
eukprot:m.94154 g.94154  ORF g.94154 m.94154 type:complete len:939 (-) comp13843_c0_seq1:261-3077(-)